MLPRDTAEEERVATPLELRAAYRDRERHTADLSRTTAAATVTIPVVLNERQPVSP